jgi:maltose alpha-D-glucosyltransferase/alpha-amylase
MPRIFLSLHLEQAGLIREMWQRIPEIPDGCQWCTFLRNHDELTLEMVTLEERKLLWDAYAPDDRMRINLGIRRRLAPLLNYDKRRIVLASAILFSLPGAPIIYYGDEIGMGDNIEIEDRNGVRLPMQWEATPNAGFSKAPAGKLYLPVNNHETAGPAAVNVRQQQDDPGSLLNAMRRLVDLRKRYPVFAQGAVEFLDILNPSVLGMLRLDLKDAFIVLHNLSGSQQVVSLRQATIKGYEPLNVTGEVAMPPRPADEWEPCEITLSPYQSIWLHRPTSQF